MLKLDMRVHICCVFSSLGTTGIQSALTILCRGGPSFIRCVPTRQGGNWVVYDDYNVFYCYDSGDVSDHGYDYESDDLPAGCHFEDDDHNIRNLAPAPTLSTAAHAPAAAIRPLAPARATHPPHGLCSQHHGAVSTNPFIQNATLDDHTECRGLVCYPVAASVEASGQTPSSDNTYSGGVIAGIVIGSVVGAALLAGFMVWLFRGI